MWLLIHAGIKVNVTVVIVATISACLLASHTQITLDLDTHNLRFEVNVMGWINFSCFFQWAFPDASYQKWPSFTHGQASELCHAVYGKHFYGWSACNIHLWYLFNSLWLRNAICQIRTGSALLWVMSCCLFVAKLWPEPMLTLLSIDPWE